MVVKAEIKTISDDSIKIAIPSLEIHSVESALIVPPGCVPNLEQGQIVYASFINNDKDRPIILGALQSSNSSSHEAHMYSRKIYAMNSAKLPNDFKALNVDYATVANIINVRHGIQSELNTVLNYIEYLYDRLNTLLTKSNENSEYLEELSNNISLLDNDITDTLALIGSNKDTEITKDTLYGRLYNLENLISLLEDKIGDFKDNQDFKSIIDGLQKALDEIQFITGNTYDDGLDSGSGSQHVQVLADVPSTWEDKMIACFGKVYPESSGWTNLPYPTYDDAAIHMKSVTCPIWCKNSNGKWFESSRSTPVHEAVSGLMQRAFETIHELPENQRQQFYYPYTNIWNFNYDHGGEHKTGTAVDLNSGYFEGKCSNPMLNRSDIKDINWPNGEISKRDPYFIKRGGPVETIMAQNGFNRGYFSNKIDYMHFSFFGW